MADTENTAVLGLQYKDAKRDRRRAEMLDAAATVFARKGYFAATMQDIAEIVGVRSASLYYYFGSKEAALEEVCRLGGRAFVDTLAANWRRATGRPFKIIEAGMKIHLDSRWRDYVASFTFNRQNLSGRALDEMTDDCAGLCCALAADPGARAINRGAGVDAGHTLHCERDPRRAEQRRHRRRPGGTNARRDDREDARPRPRRSAAARSHRRGALTEIPGRCGTNRQPAAMQLADSVDSLTLPRAMLRFLLAFRVWCETQTAGPGGTGRRQEALTGAGQHGLSKKLFIKTYGCQMNVYDSARMAEVLAPLGYGMVEAAPTTADMVILNTCHIREKASPRRCFPSSADCASSGNRRESLTASRP